LIDWVVHYPALRHLHMGLAFTSGALFALRGAGVLARHRWPLHPFLRRLSVIVDTGLLAVALRLLWELRLNPFVTPWLQVKLALLPLYILLGMLTLKYARKRRIRKISYFAALVCYGFMISVALTHSPLGALRWVGL
jgi:uncharacterized membrane protein SirB2